MNPIDRHLSTYNITKFLTIIGDYNAITKNFENCIYK